MSSQQKAWSIPFDGFDKDAVKRSRYSIMLLKADGRLLTSLLSVFALR
jgi:hypothetical protein